MLFSGVEETYSHGVAIVLNKETQYALIGYSPINDRIRKVKQNLTTCLSSNVTPQSALPVKKNLKLFAVLSKKHLTFHFLS